MRSVRKTIAEVAIRPIEGAATVKVGDEMVILMDRFAATEMSWKKVGNELYLVVTSEGELLALACRPTRFWQSCPTKWELRFRRAVSGAG